MFASEGKSLSGCGKQYSVSSIFAIALLQKQQVSLKAADMEQKGCFNYDQKKRNDQDTIRSLRVHILLCQ